MARRVRSAIVAMFAALAVASIAVFLAGLARRSVASEHAPRTAAPSSGLESAQIAARATDGTSAEPERAAASDDVIRAAPETCLLRVQAVSAEHGDPAADVEVVCIPTDVAAPRDSASFVLCDLAATSDSTHRSDSDGRVVIEVAAESAYRLGQRGRTSEALSVTPLAPGEVREIELVVATEPDRVFFGRLVDSTTRQPLAGGQVYFESDPVSASIRRARAISALDGSFELRLRSWDDRGARAIAPEYARQAFDLDDGHEAPQSALEIALERAASGEVVVRHGSRLVEGARVTLKSEGVEWRSSGVSGSSFRVWYSPAESFEGVTDARGSVSFPQLPPHVVWAACVERERGGDACDAAPIALASGEQHTFEISLGTDASISGRLEASDGRPLAYRPIWRSVANDLRPRLIEDWGDPADVVRTDAQGRFRFDDVPLGAWSIGTPFFEHADEEPELALAQVVDVLRESSAAEVVLRTAPGLYVAGRVLDADGAPVPACRVHAALESGGAVRESRADSAGRFEIGPLPEGACWLQAGGSSSSHVPSDRVPAFAGASGVVLSLRKGGSIAGRCVDADGRGCDADLTLTLVDEDLAWTLRANDDGRFVFEQQVAGRYSLAATTRADLCAFKTGIALAPGQALDGIDLQAEPGATLKLAYDGPRRSAEFAVLVAGATFTHGSISRGRSSTVLAPAGAIELDFSDASGARSTTSLTLEAGEQRELSWDGRP